MFGNRETDWAQLILAGPLLYFLKPRITLTPSAHSQRISWSFLSLPSFWVLQTGNFLQSLGYFLPSAYMASYANDIGLNRNIGALMIALFNATGVPGSVILGMLIDRYQVFNVILLSALGSVVAVILFWGLANQVALLAVFAILYGPFAGGFSATWSGVTRQLKREKRTSDTGLVFGLLAGARGVGNAISGPISSILIKTGLPNAAAHAKLGHDTQYVWLIVFTGATALLGGWGFVLRFRSSTL